MHVQRHFVWYGLALVWGALALAGWMHHRGGNAAVEGAVAVLFLVLGVQLGRRDAAAAAARYAGKRPR